MNSEKSKRLAGRRAVDDLVKSGMKLGLGTGSTAIHAVRRIGELISKGVLKEIIAVPTSFQTQIECQKLGISVLSLNDPAINGKLDLTIDGADEVDTDWNLIKGGGGAMLSEKLVASASKDYAIVVDSSKIVARLGEKAPVPVEIVPEALITATKALEHFGRVVLRAARMKDGPVISDHGNFILDIYFKKPFNPKEIELHINTIPGILENGIFTRSVTDLIIAEKDGNTVHRNK